tara:strand:+ start:151 stop:726 length:576 start_codon:yes stop_codon:yes gene_type:complete
MNDILIRISRAFAFAKVTHAEVKQLLMTTPFFLTIVTYFVSFLLFGIPGLFGRQFFTNGLSVIISLPGFLIAALAAVATFKNDSLDKEIPHPSPTISVKFQGVPEKISLTYRVFLSLLFGYLASFTLVLSFLLSAALSAPAGGLKCWVNVSYVCAATTEIARFSGLFLLIHTLVVTLYGLYYVAWRMHIRD